MIPQHGGKSVREQVFEVVVLEAIKGSPWREICAGPMRVNHITENQVEEEVQRRRTDDNRMQPTRVPKRPKRPDDETSNKLAQPPADAE